MRHFLLLLAACVGFALPSARAESSDSGDLFVSAYMAVQEGERAEQSGKFKVAMTKFSFAAKVLEQIATRDPKWQPPIIDYRRKRTAEAMTRVQEKLARYGPGKGDPNDGPSEIVEPTLPGTGADTPLNFQPAQDIALPPRSTNPTRRAATDGSSNPIQEITDRMKRLTDDLERSRQDLANAQREKEDLAKQLDSAAKAREAADSKRQVLEQRANNTESALMKALEENKKETEAVKTLQADLTSVKKQLRELKIEGEAETEYRQQLNDRMKAAQSKVGELTKERDAANKLSTDVPGKIASIQKELQLAKKERDDLQTKLDKTQAQLSEVTKQRDDAVQQVAKMREAQKQVDKLIADNSALMTKLGDAEKTIRAFKTEGAQKDEEIAALRKEVGSVKDQLAKAQKESRDYQTQMADLQQKLENTKTQLVQAKADSTASAAEKKKMQEENGILRGIVLRQQKEQARRDQTKKLVLEQLAKLEIDSKTLLSQIDYLGQPVVKLTAKERALFKKPELQVSDTEISMAAPSSAASEVSATDPAPVSTETAAATSPGSTPAPEAATPPEPAAPESTPAKSDTTAATPPPAAESNNAPIEIASNKPLTLEPSTKKTAPTDDLPSRSGEEKKGGSAASESVPAGGNAPNVPAELLPLAREGKEQFERGNYREAEKIYERILTKSPNNLYILSNLGVVRFRAGKLKLAEESFKKAIAIAPEDAFSHCTLGIVLYSEGRYDEAVTELTKAIAVSPKNATAHNYLGITASQKGWQESAQKELEAATALDPSYADAHFNLAVVFATQQPPDKENARKYYKRATELGAEPDSALEQLIK